MSASFLTSAPRTDVGFGLGHKGYVGGLQLQSGGGRLTIAGVEPLGDNPLPAPGLFARGAVVLVTLNSPREKFWGAILELTPAGLSVRGIDLNSFDDFVGQIRGGEPVMPGAVFFPMHRVERIELDLRNGPIPSLSDRFAAKTGEEPATVLRAASTEYWPIPRTRPDAR
jgi:hypothetical protein